MDKFKLRLSFIPLSIVVFVILMTFIDYPVQADSVDLYWVKSAGVGTGNWSQTAHWSTSSGGTGGHAVPTSTNKVIFDSNSFNASETMTIDVSAFCADMTWSAVTNSPTWAGSAALSIYGSFTGGILTRSYTGAITWASTATGKTVTSSGITWGSAMTFNGVGGGWQLQDALNIGSSVLTLTNGTLDTNGQILTTGNFTTASGTSTLTLGATVWNNSGNWTATNLGTLNANTSSLRFTSAATQFTGAGKTYNDVQLNGSGAAAVLDLNTFATLTRTGTAVTTDTIVFSANETITGTLTLTGGSVANRLACKSNTTSTRTLTSAANVVTNCDFYYINGAGAASWNFSANPGGAADMGGNVGLTLTSTVYWVGNSGNWVSGAGSHWSGTSGGTPHADFLPLSTVSTIFDTNSITTTSQTVTMEANSNCFNTDWSAVLYNPNIGYTGSAVWNVYGSLTLKSGMTWGPLSVNLRATSAASVNIAGATANFSGWSYATGFVFVGSGPFTILSNIDMSTTLTTVTINSGAVVNLGNYGIMVGESSLGTPLVVNGTLTMGSSTINLSTNNGAGTFSMGSTGNINMGSSTWNISGSGGSSVIFTAGGTVTAGTSTINISATTETFSGGGYTFYNLTSSGSPFTLSGNNAFNNVTITGSTTTISGANTFNNLSRIGTAALTDSISFGADQTISGTFTVTSNSATNRVLVQSNSQGTLRTISAGAVVSTNADWSDICGSGASAWNLAAGNNGDVGGNLAITFTTSANIYWFGNTGSWTDLTHWYWGTGGTGGSARVPLIQDIAILDATSFTVPGTLTLTANYRLSSINTSNVSNTPVVSATGPTFYGTTLNITGTTWSVTTTYIYGRNLTTLTTGGVSLQALTIGQKTTNGTLTLNDNLLCTGAVTLLAGSLNLNNKTLTAVSFDSSTTTYVRAITLGSGTVILNSTSAITKWNVAASNFSLYPGTSTIYLTNSGTNAQTFAGGSLTYYNLYMTGSGNYQLTLTGANTFNILAIDRSQAAKTLAGNVTSSITYLFIPVSGITVATITNPDFTMTAGIIITDYLSISGSVVNGGATFYAGSHSTNGGSNSGWIFSDPGGPFPTATTNSVTGLTNSGVTLKGTLSNKGSYTPVYGYFQYDLDGTYLSPISTSLQSLAADGVFSQAVTSLQYNTVYHYRAVVVYNISTYSYGTDTAFVTLGAPTIATGDAVNITTTATTIQGTVVLNSYSSVYVYFEYGTTTSYGNHTQYQYATTGTVFTQSLTALTSNTTYHFRADVVYGSSLTTIYGSDNTFTTSSLSAPSVTTVSSSSVSYYGATLNGSLTYMGDNTIVYVSFRYGTTTSYGSSSSSVTMTAVGTFSIPITNLSNNQTYHFQAMATYNSGQNSYGGDLQLTTVNSNPTSTPGTYVAQLNPTNTSVPAGSILAGNPNLPSQMYTEGGNSSIPGIDIIAVIFGVSGTPPALWWFPFLFLGIAIISLLIYEATTAKGTAEGSLLTQCIVIEVLLAAAALIGTASGNPGMIPLWPTFLFPIPATALILARRHVGWG